MVTYGIEGSSAVYYRIWDGSSWSAQASVAAAAGITGDASWLVTATDYTSDRIALATMTSAGEIWLSVWDGTAWDTPVLAETGTHGHDLSESRRRLREFDRPGAGHLWPEWPVRFPLPHLGQRWRLVCRADRAEHRCGTQQHDPGQRPDQRPRHAVDPGRQQRPSLPALGRQRLEHGQHPVDQHRRDQEPAVRVHLRPGRHAGRTQRCTGQYGTGDAEYRDRHRCGVQHCQRQPDQRRRCRRRQCRGHAERNQWHPDAEWHHRAHFQYAATAAPTPA